MLDDTFTIHYGSSLNEEMVWPDGSGGAADLTGFSVEMIEKLPASIPNLDVAIVTAVEGKISLRMDRDDSIQLPRGRIARYRVRVIPPSDDFTGSSTNLIWIEVK